LYWGLLKPLIPAKFSTFPCPPIKRLEQEKLQSRNELSEAKSELESAHRSRSTLEKQLRDMELHFTEYNTKVESLNVFILELQSANSRLQQDRTSLEAELEHAQTQANGSGRFKQQYQRQVDEITHSLEEETRLRLTVTQQFKAVSEDYESIKMMYEEEMHVQTDLRAKLAKVTSECLMWKSKFESESSLKTEELDDCKRKFALKLTEAEDQVEQALLKVCIFHCLI
jgi:chromosome segregation ATPase